MYGKNSEMAMESDKEADKLNQFNKNQFNKDRKPPFVGIQSASRASCCR